MTQTGGDGTTIITTTTDREDEPTPTDEPCDPEPTEDPEERLSSLRQQVSELEEDIRGLYVDKLSAEPAAKEEFVKARKMLWQKTYEATSLAAADARHNDSVKMEWWYETHVAWQKWEQGKDAKDTPCWTDANKWHGWLMGLRLYRSENQDKVEDEELLTTDVKTIENVAKVAHDWHDKAGSRLRRPQNHPLPPHARSDEVWSNLTTT